MLRALCHGFLFMLLMISASAIEAGYPRCNCDIDGFFSAEAILQCQKVSDFLIAAAYFSIPLELLYFATCSDLFPFKWIVFQFGAFIVLCGLTHLLNVFTYEPHSFILMLSLTISKLFTALVSFATTITLLTLIPQLLRVKVRENFLRIKARELDREVGMMKRQEEASWHVRMLTQEIRKSLDRHTILYTTLVELSKTLGLQNCAIWMPDECNKMMNLTHELRQRRSMELYEQIPINDRDVVEVHGLKGVKILRPDSLLALVSNGGDPEPGSIASIRMPMLKVSNFKGGTPELVQASYAILVLVLPREDSRIWSHHELEIIEVIADQVAVALSHAAVLEESQLMREKLVEQNRTLMQEKKNALMASEARNSFQKVMSQGMRRPIHSILGLLSMMQREKISSEQRLIINTVTKISGVVSTLITDAMEISNINGERLTLEMRSFHLHSMIKEAASVARCLCDCRGFGFGVQVDNAVPDRVVGDEKRIFHAILHVIDKLLSAYDEGFVSFQVHNCCSESQGNHDQEWIAWKSNFPGVSVKFEIGIKTAECSDSSLSVPRAWRLNAESYDMGLSFNMCKELVQMMHGDIWVVPNFQGYPKSIKLVLQFQQQPLSPVSELSGSLGQPHHTPSSSPNFKGLRVLLADDDDVNRAVTRKLLEKLGCKVTSVSSGAQCLGSLSASGTPYQLVILDLHMPLMNGFEVAMRIRKLRSRSWPAIVAVTASAEEQVWQRCLQAGMNGLIRKPVMLQAIGDELYRVLHNT